MAAAKKEKTPATPENLKLWTSVEKTDPSHTKEVRSGGRKYTAIDAMYQIKCATEEFGPYGSTWGLSETNFSTIDGLPNNEVLLVLNATFYAPNGVEFPVSSSTKLVSYVKNGQYNKVDDDAYKKVETDVTTKALSKLGFNSDVFMGKFDDNKYVGQMRKEFSEKEPEPEVELKPLSHSKFTNCLKKFVAGDREQFKRAEANGYFLSDEQKEQIIAAHEEIKKYGTQNKKQ